MPKVQSRDGLKQLVRQFLSLEANNWLLQVHSPLPFDEWVSRYPLSRQRELREARESVERDGLLGGDARVGCFIKNETSTKATDPRNISPRTDRFLSVMGPYVAALDKAAHDAPYLVKGLDIPTRSAKMAKLMEFEKYLEIDYTRFDSTISRTMIVNVEAFIFSVIFPKADHPLLHAALKFAQTTIGVTPLGIIYFVEGTRCSGDAHTSIANGLLNFFMFWVLVSRLPPDAWLSYHEGDDGIAGIKSKYWKQVLFNCLILQCLGFEAKLAWFDQLQLTTFCGRSHVPIGGALMSMCDLPRTLSKIHITTSNLKTRTAALAKAYSYWATDRHTPIVGTVCWALIKLLGGNPGVRKSITRCRTIRPHEKGKILRGLDMHHDLVQVPSELRVATELKYGLSVAQQHAIENQALGWVRMGYIPHTFQPLLVNELHVGTDNAHYHGHAYPNFV